MVEFFSSWSTADRINAALLGVAVLGILLTWWQSRAGAKTQRAAFLRDLYATINSDAGICDAFYNIEYGRFVYDSNFHGSDQERNVDRLLSFVDLVCELHRRRILKKREMRFFEYRFRRIAGDSNVQEYLSFLNTFYAINSTQTGPFPSFTIYKRRLHRRDQVKQALSRILMRVLPRRRQRALTEHVI